MSSHVCVSRVVRCTALAVVVGVFLLATAAQAASIGFNFSGGWQSGPFPLLATDTIGAVPQTNWNNWMGASGQSNQNYTNIPLVDNTGASTTAKAQVGPYFFQNDGGPLDATALGRFYGCVTREGNGNNWTAGFSAIPYLKYDVYAYTKQNQTVSLSGAATGNGSQSLTYGGSIATYIQGSNYLKWSGVSGSSFTIASTSNGMANVAGFQIVQALKPIISLADGGWGDGTTWDLAVSPNTASDYDVTVRHNVSFNEAAQVVSSLTLDNLNSNMTILAGAGLTGATDVQLGTLTVNGGLTATTLKVSGGSATMGTGSTGAIGALNVTAGSATVAAGSAATIGTVSASGGTTYLGRNATSLAVSGTGTLNTTAAITAPAVTVSGTGILDTTGGALTATTVGVSGGTATLVAGGTIGTVNASGGTTNLATTVSTLNLTGTASVLGGAGGGAGTAVLKTGSTLNTQGNYMSFNKITMPDAKVISVSSGSTVDLMGANLGAGTISNMRLNGGTVSMSGPAASSTVTVQATKAPTVWTGSTGGTLSGVTFTAGQDGMLVAMASGETPSITSVTWTPTGGTPQAMASAANAGIANAAAGIFYLMDPVVTDGTGKLDYVSGGGSRATVGALYATGVLGRESFSSATAAAQSLKPGAINVSAGALVVSDAGHTNGSSGMTSTFGTQLYNLTGSSSGGAARYGVSLAAGSNDVTWTTAAASGSMAAAIASFAPAIRPAFSVDLGATSLVLTADTTLDIGVATAASFFDVFLEVGVTYPKTLRITGSNWSAVSGLASIFDVTAPSNALVSLGATDGSTYQDIVVIPEPATMSLLVLGGIATLIRRRNRR